MPRLLVEKIEASYLKPGDLYSDKGSEFWTKPKLWALPLFMCMSQPPKGTEETVFRIRQLTDTDTEMNPKKPPGVE